MDMDKLIQEATDFIMQMCAPENMGQHDAATFLEGVLANVEGSLDAIREEIGNE